MKKIFLIITIALITLLLQGCPSQLPYAIYIRGIICDRSLTTAGDKILVRIDTRNGVVNNASVSINATSFHPVGNGTYLPPPGFVIPYGSTAVMTVDTGQTLYIASGAISLVLVLTSPASGSIFASTAVMPVLFTGFNTVSYVYANTPSTGKEYRLEKAYLDPTGLGMGVSLICISHCRTYYANFVDG